MSKKTFLNRKAILNKKVLEVKIEQEQEEQDKILIHRPKKTLLGVANPYLASELGYHIAKYTSLNVLVIDADGLTPIISTCLGMKELVNDRIQSDLENQSSFNMAMEYTSRTPRPVPEIFKNIAVQHYNNKNLYVLTGNDDIQKDEDYSITAFELLLRAAQESFDLVLLNVSYNIHDAFYLTALDYVEYMLYAFPAYADDIMSFNRLISYLDMCERAAISKHCYIPFDYSPSRQMPLSDVKAVTNNTFLGVVTGDKNRQQLRNEFNRCYAKNMSKKNTNEYHRLAKSFGIQTKKKMFSKRS